MGSLSRRRPEATTTCRVASAAMAGGTYDAVVFDFGGVFTQSPFEAVRLHGDVKAVFAALYASGVDGLFSDFPGLATLARARDTDRAR